MITIPAYLLVENNQACIVLPDGRKTKSVGYKDGIRLIIKILYTNSIIDVIEKKALEAQVESSNLVHSELVSAILRPIHEEAEAFVGIENIFIAQEEQKREYIN